MCGEDRNIEQDVFYLITDTDEIDRESKIRGLSDETLLYFYRKLHSTALLPSPWLISLEAEIRRRGLISLS